MPGELHNRAYVDGVHRLLLTQGLRGNGNKAAETSGTPSKMSHLKAGQDEVHSFFWGKDLEKPVASQQNEPVIGGQLAASDIRHRCDPTALVLPISNGTRYLQHAQDTPISKMKGITSDCQT